MSSRCRSMPAENPPKTVDEAVERLIHELPLKYRAKIAKMNGRDLSALHATIGPYIREHFGLWRGNDQLMESCRVLNGRGCLHIDSGSMVILEVLWERLNQTHAIRALK